MLNHQWTKFPHRWVDWFWRKTPPLGVFQSLYTWFIFYLSCITKIILLMIFLLIMQCNYQYLMLIYLCICCYVLIFEFENPIFPSSKLYACVQVSREICKCSSLTLRCPNSKGYYPSGARLFFIKTNLT